MRMHQGLTETLLCNTLILYEIGKLLRLALGSIVFIRIPVWPYTIANLLIGAAFLWLRFDRYGKDSRLEERV